MLIRAQTVDSSSNATAGEKPVKLSINVSAETGNRLRRIAYGERLSESSIVQIALTLMFDKTTDAKVGEFLRNQGASLRRG
jgi:hypothetical protein